MALKKDLLFVSKTAKACLLYNKNGILSIEVYIFFVKQD